MLHLSRHLWAPAVLLIFTTAVRAQDAPQPAGTTQPAAQDLSAEALAPKVPAAPKSDEEIVSRLELLDTELQRLGPTTQPSTAPATGPADRLASARWRLGQVLQQYRSGLDRWRQARIDIAALKSPKQSDQLAADLDRWSRQQKRIEEQRQDLARHAWRAQTLLDQAEKNKEHEDLAAELRRMEALQTARESQLTALAARQTETKTAIDKTLADLKAYAAGLPAKAAEAATPEDRAVLLTEKRILEWQHGLQLLRAGSWSDLNLHLEIPLRQDGDRVKVLRELVNAIQQYRDAIHKIVTGDTIAQARENLARPDLPDYERTYWQIRLTLLQAVADFQAYRQFIEDTRLQTQEFDPDRLGQQIARGRWYLDEFLESLDRRSGQIIIEIHRTLGERLAVNEDRLRTVRTHLDLMADKLRAAQDRKDETATRVLLGQTRLEDEIKQLEGDQLAQARDLQTRLTTEVNKSIKEEIDAVVTELAALHDRFDKLVPVLTDHIKRLRVARSALYWRRLTVAGRSLFDQDWSGLLAEVRAVASGQGEMGQRVRSQCDLLTRQWREVPLQRHLAVAVLVLLSILLGRRARSRLRAWLEASDEAIEMARQEAQEGGRAFELGPAFRLQIQSARAAAHASLILWPLVTLVLYGLWLRSEGLTFPLLSMVLGLVAVALAGPPLVSAIFDSKRPHLRVIRCDDPVARFHRWWLKSLGLAALVLLPWPLMLDQLGVTAILRRVVSEVGLTAFLLLSLLYLVRRSRFVALLAPTNGQPGLLAGFLVRLYLLLPLFVAVMIGLQVAGYAALAKYMAQGIGLSLLIALAGKVASALLAAWAGLIEKFITSHMSHAAREAEAPPPHPLWRFLAQVTRLGVFVAAVAGILAVWGISLVELHQL
ncbi:MAG TPA: hypothetical protein VLM89_17900, partial [Phycisphaerae bacterium]|nr:hypothetical protein [Phycisphaerae bacterium]